MRYALFALALLPAAAIAGDRGIPQPAAKRPAACQNANVDLAVQRDAPVRIRTLKQEPLAAQYLGVVRLEDGCDKPVKIANRVGDKQR